MTTMRVILTRAIRMTRARGLSATPSSDEIAAALEDAQGMFLTFPVRQLTDVLITANYTAGENERITFTSGSWVVTYPTTVTVSGVERPPQNGAMVEVAGASGSTRKIYIAELKTWMTITALTLDTEQPFGPTHDLDVSAMICARICGPVFQREIPPEVAQLAAMGRTMTRKAFRQTYTPNFDRALVGPSTLNSTSLL